MATSINHTGFVVSDLEASVAFYRDVVGMKIVREFERTGTPIAQVVGYEGAHLKGVHLGFETGPTLELIFYVVPPAGQRPTEERSVLGGTHLAFTVDDIDEAYQNIIGGGGHTLNPPVDLSADRRACYLQDPDGNWLELIEML